MGTEMSRGAVIMIIISSSCFRGTPLELASQTACKPRLVFNFVKSPKLVFKLKLLAKIQDGQSKKQKKSQPENCFILKIQQSQEHCESSTSSSFNAEFTCTWCLRCTHFWWGILDSCSDSCPGPCLSHQSPLTSEPGTPGSRVRERLNVLRIPKSKLWSLMILRHDDVHMMQVQ